MWMRCAWISTVTSRISAAPPAPSAASCLLKTPPAITSRSCSAFPCAFDSSPISRGSTVCVPECRWSRKFKSQDNVAQSAARGLEALAQSVPDCHHGDVGHLYGGARFLHCQRRSPAHGRLSRRIVRRSHLGAYQLPGLERDRSAGLRLAVDGYRPEAVLYVVRRAVYRMLFPVWDRAQSAVPYRGAHLARCRRRRIAAFR